MGWDGTWWSGVGLGRDGMDLYEVGVVLVGCWVNASFKRSYYFRVNFSVQFIVNRRYDVSQVTFHKTNMYTKHKVKIMGHLVNTDNICKSYGFQMDECG